MQAMRACTNPTTDYRVIFHWASWKKWSCHFFAAVFHPILFKLVCNNNVQESSEFSKFVEIPTTHCRVSSPWACEKSPYTYKGKIVLPVFLSCSWSDSFSYLQVMMIYIRARMSLKFSQIQPRTTELAALERFKIRCHLFSVANCLIHFKFWPRLLGLGEIGGLHDTSRHSCALT